MKYVILKSKQVQVRPYQRKGKFVVGYQRWVKEGKGKGQVKTYRTTYKDYDIELKDWGTSAVKGGTFDYSITRKGDPNFEFHGQVSKFEGNLDDAKQEIIGKIDRIESMQAFEKPSRATVPEGVSTLSAKEFEENGGYTIGVGAWGKLYTLRHEFNENYYEKDERGQVSSVRVIRRSYFIRNLGKDWEEVVQKLPAVMREVAPGIEAKVFLPGFSGKLDPNAKPHFYDDNEFFFGKYAGKSLEDVKRDDPQYLIWLAEEYGTSDARKQAFLIKIREMMQAELDQRAKEREQTKEKQKAEKVVAGERLKELADVIETYITGGGSFAASLTKDLREGRPLEEMSDKVVGILRDMYCKNFGRRGSKAYKKADEEFDKFFATPPAKKESFVDIEGINRRQKEFEERLGVPEGYTEEGVKKGMKFVILQKAKEVRVRPYQRKGKFVIGYTRIDPRDIRRKIEEESVTRTGGEIERMQMATWNDIKEQMEKNLNQIRTEHRGHPIKVSGKFNADHIGGISKNMQNEVTSYQTYLAGDTMNLLHRYMGVVRELLDAHQKEFGNIDGRVLNEMFIDSIRKLVYQEIESNRHQFNDHGIRHIVKNIMNQQQILDKLEKGGVKISGRDRLLGAFIMINHDIGYAAPIMRTGGEAAIKVADEHTRYSRKITEEQKKLWNLKKVFDPDEYNRALLIIQTHERTDLDLTDPVGTASRLADNLALFQEEKLPSMFKYIEGSEDILLRMAEDAKNRDYKSFGEHQRELFKKINTSHLNNNLKRDLRSAVGEMNFMTPKFAMGTLAGEIKQIGSTAKSLISVTIKHNNFDETLQKMFDMGQRQVKKFLEHYGEKDFSKDKYRLGEYKGKAILEIKVSR